MKTICLALLALLLGCSSAGNQPANEPTSSEEPSGDERSVVPISRHYSELQLNKLTACSGYGVVVYHALLAKDAGSTIETELAIIREQSPESLNGPLEMILRDLYSQPADTHFAVMNSFYDELCVTAARIAEGQKEIAQRCLLATYISMAAYAAHVGGGPEAGIQQYFAAHDATRSIAKPIVARAYAADTQHIPAMGYLRYAPLAVDEWLGCFEEAERS